MSGNFEMEDAIEISRRMSKVGFVVHPDDVLSAWEDYSSVVSPVGWAPWTHCTPVQLYDCIRPYLDKDFY